MLEVSDGLVKVKVRARKKRKRPIPDPEPELEEEEDGGAEEDEGGGGDDDDPWTCNRCWQDFKHWSSRSSVGGFCVPCQARFEHAYGDPANYVDGDPNEEEYEEFLADCRWYIEWSVELQVYEVVDRGNPCEPRADLRLINTHHAAHLLHRVRVYKMNPPVGAELSLQRLDAAQRKEACQLLEIAARPAMNC